MVTASKRVLVVDDEEIVRDSCWRVLTDAGYTVQTVSSGRDALRACRSEPVDVLLTDIRMPDMDGIHVARTIREEFPDVRVVIITGYPSQQSASQAEQLGIFDYLEKPLSPERLSEATAAALAGSPRWRADDVLGQVALAAAPSAPEVDCEPETSERSASLPVPATTESPTQSDEPRNDSVDRQEQLAITAATSEDAATEPVETASKASPLKMLAVMAVAPLLGLAFVVFLPVIGFGMLFVALASGLTGKASTPQT